MIRIRPVGHVNEEILFFLRDELSEMFGSAKVLPQIEIPKNCYNSYRGQYNSTCILRKLDAKWITLGVIEEDIYADRLNFVFGEAEINGSRAVISTYRLKVNADMELLKIRTLKEAIHEIGHVLGLKHCKDRSCVMCFSNSVFDVDAKTLRYCKNCLSRLKIMK
jgi:archaemetzincin